MASYFGGAKYLAWHFGGTKSTCGIAGILNFKSRPGAQSCLEIARAMGRALIHRGPDGEGHWHDTDAGIAFAHRRLAIIDLSPTGAQPMISANGRYVLITNGEIYNFRTLRREIEQTGAHFRGNSDTKVLVEAIAHWGIETTIDRADSMFAFAVWDRETRELHLVRDRFGVKPLYWGRIDGTLVFASELKALRQHPGWTGELDTSALDAYFRFACVPAPATIHANIHKLEPATHLILSADKEPAQRRYWASEQLAEEGLDAPFTDPRDAEEQIEVEMRRAVSDQLVSDVPLGVFLSGGVDSAMVVAFAQSATDRPVPSPWASITRTMMKAWRRPGSPTTSAPNTPVSTSRLTTRWPRFRQCPVCTMSPSQIPRRSRPIC